MEQPSSQESNLNAFTNHAEYAKALFNLSPDGMFLMDVQGVIIDGNKRTEEILGLKKEFLIGKNVFEIEVLTRESRLHALIKMQEAFNGAPSETLELKINHADGKLIDIEAKAHSFTINEKTYFIGTIHDITERQQQERKLIESEAKFRYLADFTFEWEYWINPKGKYVYISPSCEQTTGYLPSAFEENPKLLIDITHPDYKKEVEKHFTEELNDTSKHIMEFQIVKPNGETVWIEHSCQPIFDPEGKYLGKRGINRNITNRKKNHKALEESNQRFKNLSQLTFEGILIHKDGIIKDVNSAFEKQSGYSRNELLGKALSDIIQTSALKKSVQENIKKEYAKPYETTFKRKNGTIINIEIEAKNYTIDGEEFRVAAVRDITARKRQALRQDVVSRIASKVIQDIDFEKLLNFIQTELHKLVDATNFYYAVYDKETDSFTRPYYSDKNIQYPTFPAKDSLTGYLIKNKKSLLLKRQEIVDFTKSNKLISRGKEAFQWLGVPLFNKKQEATGAFVIQSYTNENAYAIEDLKILEVIASHISLALERKHNEENLFEALVKAQESDRLKSTFLATMSHELRTPLNAIIGFSDLVENDRPKEEIINFCRTINRSGNHLLGIVNEIFDFTLIETGEIKLSYNEYPLSSILKDVFLVIQEEQTTLLKQDIDLSYHIPEKYQNLKIKTDQQRLQQVLLNLLKNALKFTDSGSIKYGFNVLTKENKQSLQFYVEDTGIGIAKEKQEIIFDVFRQADDSHTRKHDGVGLGLSISRKILSIMRGNIWLKSDVGAGSTFYFDLPCTMDIEESKAVKKIISNKESTDYKNRTILIAEDEETNFSLLEYMLAPFKMKIIWAKDGQEAFDLFLENPNIDLILMDIRMPKMNGLEVTKKIKEIKPNLPIIAQTAYAISGDKELALYAGCDDYLSKPINKISLKQVINKYLN